MIKKYTFQLSVEVEIDGEEPGKVIIVNEILDALNEGMPTILTDDHEDDYAIIVNSFRYEFTGEEV